MDEDAAMKAIVGCQLASGAFKASTADLQLLLGTKGKGLGGAIPDGDWAPEDGEL